jgi:hypothetical protein
MEQSFCINYHIIFCFQFSPPIWWFSYICIICIYIYLYLYIYIIMMAEIQWEDFYMMFRSKRDIGIYNLV